MHTCNFNRSSKTDKGKFKVILTYEGKQEDHDDPLLSLQASAYVNKITQKLFPK